MDGGRDWLRAREEESASPDLGFVARALFSCSKRASSREVDCYHQYQYKITTISHCMEPTSSVASDRGSCSSVLSSSSQSTESLSTESLPAAEWRLFVSSSVSCGAATEAAKLSAWQPAESPLSSAFSVISPGSWSVGLGCDSEASSGGFGGFDSASFSCSVSSATSSGLD